MADNSSNNNSRGIGFLGMLTILFIGLKLTKNIDWSWLWVLSPLWIPMAFALSLLLAGLIIVGLVTLVTLVIAKLTGRGGAIELPKFIQRWQARRALKRYTNRLK